LKDVVNFERLVILFFTILLLTLPYFVYNKLLSPPPPHGKSEKLTLKYRIIKNIHITIFFSLFYFLLFSFYKNQEIIYILTELSDSFNIKFIITSFIITIFILFAYTIFKNKNGLFYFDLFKTPKYILCSLFIFFFLVNVSFEFSRMYGIIPIEQFVFHLALPATGANFSMAEQFAIKPLVDTVFMLVFSMYILSLKVDIKGHCIYLPFDKFKKSFVIIAALLPIMGIMCVTVIIQLPQYILSHIKEPSAFYENEYIFPEYVNFSFPEKKRNLIVIFVESLETGFLTVENGGAFVEDLMPEVASLAVNNINYSQNTGIGGIVQLYGTEWTIAGIASCYLGIPLAVNFLNQTQWNNYSSLGSEFLPGAYGIGDILQTEGYKNYFILGSNVEFGGRDIFFKTHKDTVVFDYHYFHDNNYIPDNYKVWWGIEDRKLYQLAKTKITEIALEEPFFITLLTADTHPTGGYLDEQAEIIFDSQYKNVLRDMSKQLQAFVEWLYRQPFYENTTIVILGDHLYQNSSFFPENFSIQDLSSRYERKYFTGGNKENYNRYVINIFVNSLLSQDESKNRSISHFDILPLLIESIGGSYDAEGLALGRSLSIAGMTLVEKYGVQSMNEHLRQTSKLYNSFWF
jgi:phosphoglycerol transferase